MQYSETPHISEERIREMVSVSYDAYLRKLKFQRIVLQTSLVLCILIGILWFAMS